MTDDQLIPAESRHSLHPYVSDHALSMLAAHRDCGWQEITGGGAERSVLAREYRSEARALTVRGPLGGTRRERNRGPIVVTRQVVQLLLAERSRGRKVRTFSWPPQPKRSA